MDVLGENPSSANHILVARRVYVVINGKAEQHLALVPKEFVQ
jgi:hypothetical protein